jgi:hypothetical protein
MRNTIIKITRNNEYYGKIRALKVFIDDKHVGNAMCSSTFEFALAPGQHTVYVKMDWCRSAPVAIDLAAGDSAEFVVTFPSWLLPQLYATLLKPSKFFRLEKHHQNKVSQENHA